MYVQGRLVTSRSNQADFERGARHTKQKQTNLSPVNPGLSNSRVASRASELNLN